MRIVLDTNCLLASLSKRGAYFNAAMSGAAYRKANTLFVFQMKSLTNMKRLLDKRQIQ